MQNVCIRCGSVAGVLVFVWCMLAAAQTRVFVDIDQVGGYLLPIAVPKLLGEQFEPELGEQIRAVLRSDLELTGLFRLVEPATYIDETPEALDRLRYQNWATVGAMGVIAGRVQRSVGDAQLKLDFILHDVVQQQPRFNGREYLGTREQYREMVHRFSDLVFREFTGEEGPFNTQVICVVPRRAGNKAKDIVLMDYDGYGAQSLVADGALNLAPVLSPDGTLLAYTSYRGGAPQIYLRHVFTGAEERLTSGGGVALPGSWSPDGRYLALSQTVDGNTDLYLYEIRQKRLTRLTTDWGIDVSPSFAADGKRIAFVSDRSGNPQIYLTDISGRPPARLTYDGRYNTSPVWSPRGDVIAFVGRSEGQRQTLDVYTMRADGSRLQRLTNSGTDNEAPTWAPNGRFVMYTSSRGGGWQRRLMRENGQGDRSLTANGTACLSPQWVARTAR